jgi:isoleucyl-tRNA synthetase
LSRWERFEEVREKVTKALEDDRQAKKIGTSLEARLILRCGPKAHEYLSSFEPGLRFLFVVSEVGLVEDAQLAADAVEVTVERE